MKTIYITEQQYKLLKEAQDEFFSLNELININSFKGRYQYCLEHLGKPQGRGSSRVIFQLSDEKILKLAFNQKGIEQNYAEYDGYLDDLGIVPHTYDMKDGIYIVSEFVLPAKEKDFKQCLGITWDEFVKFIITSWELRCGNPKKLGNYIYSQEKYVDMLENNETLYAFDDYIGNYRPPKGDLVSLRNYGMTNRDGKPQIVLLDAGLTQQIWDNFYKR